jgi:hypothetical protein
MMLRTLCFAVALAAPGLAAAEPRPAVQITAAMEIRSHDEGALMGHAEAYEQTADGRIVSAEAPELAPAEAPGGSASVAPADDTPFVVPARQRSLLVAENGAPAAQRNRMR